MADIQVGDMAAEKAPEWLTEVMFYDMRALIYDVQYLTFIGHPALDTCEEFKKKLGSRAEALIEAIDKGWQRAK